MSISINSAINAYNNAARISRVNNSEDNSSNDSATSSSGGSGSSPFAALIEKSIGGTIGSLRQAESAALGNITNKADIADVVTAISQAEITLKTVVAVRDRLVGAFQELEKMPI